MSYRLDLHRSGPEAPNGQSPLSDPPQLMRTFRSPEVIVDDYVEKLTAGLVGLVPDEVKVHLRNETAFWLERHAADLQQQGVAPGEAALQAVRKHGRPSVVAENLVEEYFENAAESPCFRKFGRGPFTVFTILAAAHLIYMALLQLRVFLPSGAAYSLPLTPADARVLLPEPFPLPLSGLDFTLLYGYPVVAPMVAGWIAGALVPVHAARYVARTILPIVVYSFFVGVLTLPMTTGLLFAIFVFVFWLPVAVAFAVLGGAVTRARRIRRWMNEGAGA